MLSLRILWSPTAINHFSQWVRYIAKNSLKAAENQRLKILKSVNRLKRFPQSGRMVPEFGNPLLREIVKNPIRVIYQIRGNEVRILAFHHSKRELDLSLFF